MRIPSIARAAVFLAGAGPIGPAWCDESAFSEKTSVEESRLADPAVPIRAL